MRARPAVLLLPLLNVLLFVGAWAQPAPTGGPAPDGETAPSAADRTQVILHMLDYVAVDYADAVQDGRVADQAEYDEQREFVGQARALLAQLEPPPQAALIAEADRLAALVADKAPADQVAAAARHLALGIVAAYGAETAPRRLPDLERGARLYASHCATCHGSDGAGDGPAGQSLEPPPASFQDRARMARRSVYGLYSTITLGVSGTAMASYAGLPEGDRWALAFHVANLGQSEADTARGAELWRAGQGAAVFRDVASLTAHSAEEVAAEHGPGAAQMLAYLRQHPELVAATPSAAIARSIHLLRESLAAYRDGRGRQAQALAASSYLDAFELAEAAVDARDRGLRTEIEAAMMRYRGLLREGAPVARVADEADAIEALLVRAREQVDAGALTATTVFVSAAVILLREGLEALLIVAAMYALLVRAGRRRAVRYLHAGWIAALLAGGVTWLAASHLIAISGATRETTEGVSALTAAVVLLYVGFWMHGKAHAVAWQAYVDRQLAGALGRGTLWTLPLVSFVAVYREAFETVLFYETLALQSGAGGRWPLVAGLLAGAAILAVLGFFVVRGSARMPLGLFFNASSALIALLAVILAGKGIASLQAAGVLPAHHVGVPSAPILGIFPTLEGLLVQAALLAAIAAVVVASRARRSSPSPPGGEGARPAAAARKTERVS